jgi:hypothetical protein
MTLPTTSTTCRVGMISAIVVVVLTIAYAITLGFGFAALSSAEQPIGDPWFSVLELLNIAMMPAMVTMMAAVHAWAPPDTKALSLSALTFMSMVAALTVAVHFTIVVLGRSPQFAGASWAPLLLSFRWPSLPYVLDILAWDLFFALSMLFAAPVFDGSPLAMTIRILMLLSGLLALGGLGGVVTGDMSLRNIGILGYAGIFPIVAALLAMLFHREAATARCGG